MSSGVEANCSLLVRMPDKQAMPSSSELITELENTDPLRKCAAVKKAIMLVLSGEEMPKVLFTVIRFCMTVEHHALQKLLMLFYEVVRKYDSAGKLLPEMILVTNALRNNLLHPNEYIRGCTLRFLCKLKEQEIVEPLVPAVKQCLSHRHPYVRRNAVLTAFSITRQFSDIYPDATDDIQRLLEDEADSGTRRNAFMMMFATSQERASQYLAANIDKVLNFGDGFALILLELIRKVARAESAHRTKFIRVVFSLLENPSTSVAYEAAGTLASLSSAPTAIRACANTYIKILVKESDNNVKLIVLERIAAMRKRHAKTLRELIMDLLRSLSTPNTAVRSRTLEVAMDLVSPRNVEEVMALLKKEIIATGSKSVSSSGSSSSTAVIKAEPEALEYRSMLVSAIHGCAVRFPEVAYNVVHLLMDFLNADGALSVIEFVREIIESYPEMRRGILVKLRDVAGEISASEVYRVALWILGQYSESDDEVAAALHTIRECIGPLPLTMTFVDFTAMHNEKISASAASAAEAVSSSTSNSSKPAVLADGTYATQSGLGSDAPAGGAGVTDPDEVPVPSLRKQLLAGDFFLGSVVASTLTKLALRISEHHGRESKAAKAVIVDAMLVMCSLVELGASGLAGTITLLPPSLMPVVSGRSYGSSRATPASGAAAGPQTSVSNGTRIDQDNFERVVLCMRVLGDPQASAATLPVLLRSCRDTFRGLLVERHARTSLAIREGAISSPSIVGSGFAIGNRAPGTPRSGNEEKKGEPSQRVAPEQQLSIRQLKGTKGGAYGVSEELALDDVADLSKAAGGGTVEDFQQRLKRVHQLTGFADPVYAEAYVRVHEYDIVLEMLVINRTDTTLTNVTVELSVMGDLKVVERPQPFTLGPRDSKAVKGGIKVASTATGHIFGNIVYGGASGADQTVINLAEIHVDIMDYVVPAQCSDATFRAMWADFEWENKVSVNTNVTSLHEFIHLIARQTNMRILTPVDTLPSTVSFLVANLYARSVFGEDALVNISVESRQEGAIKGHVRIRAKTQGVALSIGDRISAKQKGSVSSTSESKGQ